MEFEAQSLRHRSVWVSAIRSGQASLLLTVLWGKVGFGMYVRRILSAVSVAVLLWGSGCARVPVHKALDPSVPSQIAATDCWLVVTQEEISMFVVESTTGRQMVGGGGGVCCMMMGAAIDKSVNESRSRNAETWIRPLLDQTADVDFRGDFRDSLTAALRSIDWLKVSEVNTLAMPTPESGTTAESRSNFRVDAFHNLSPDGRVLVLTARIRFWMPEEEKAVYFGYLSYYSDPADAADPEANVKLWAENGASLYRQTLSHGIGQLMRLLRIDLPDAGAPALGQPARAAKIRVRSPVNEVKATWKGQVLEQADGRIVFRHENGNLFSLSAVDLEAEIASAEGSAP